MRLIRLAKILELKYGLQSNASSIQEVFNDIKRDIINSYNLYVDGNKAKEPILQLLSDNGEKSSKLIINTFEDTIANLDKYSPVQLFNRVNKILGIINEVKINNSVREFIHDLIKINKESDKKYREHVKSKFEMVITRLSSILEKQAKILNKFLPKNLPLQGGVVEPQRKELSKDKILRFMLTPEAVNYGLDNVETLEKVLFYPDLKEKFTTIVNAIDRGHSPVDGYDLKNSINEIMELYKQRIESDNSELFGEEK